MSIADDYPSATAVDLLGKLRAKKVSSVELVDTAIARIEALDGPINAVIVRDFDRARDAARTADAQLARGEGGVLCGLPMTVKESYDLTGFETTWGVEDFRGYRATQDAAAVQRLKAEGAIILGKTNISPMLADWQSANRVYGRTRNPHDTSRSPGGSSGGSAAALAAGFTALELGSDIGGSIRFPAAFNGVFGHKSSYGIVPLAGHMPSGLRPALAPMGVGGPLARSAADLRLALEVVAAPSAEDSLAFSLKLPEPRRASLRDYRILILDSHPSARVDNEIVAAIHRLAQRLEKAGATVGRDTSILPDLAKMHRTYLTTLITVTSRRAGSGRDPINAWRWLDLVDEQATLRRQWADVFRQWDVVVAPTFGSAAFPHTDESDWKKRSILIDGEATPYGDQLAWAGLANLTNLPSTAFPLGLNSEGLPIGAQAIGPYLEDLTTIAFAGLAAEPVVTPKLKT